MLFADGLPELAADLVAALPGLNVEDLTHGGEEGGGVLFCRGGRGDGVSSRFFVGCSWSSCATRDQGPSTLGREKKSGSFRVSPAERGQGSMWAQAHTHAKRGARIGIDGENVIAMGVGGWRMHTGRRTVTSKARSSSFFLSPAGEREAHRVPLDRHVHLQPSWRSWSWLRTNKPRLGRVRKTWFVVLPPKCATLTSMTSGGAWLLL